MSATSDEPLTMQATTISQASKPAAVATGPVTTSPIVTKAGMDIWRHAMNLRGGTERELGDVLSKEERAELATLLKKLTLHIEQ